MNGKFWKWLNRIFATGIWLQPFVMAGLILFFRAVFGQRPSILSLFFLSWLPSVYVWSENQRQRAAGKTEFGIEDTFHDRPTQYESPLKMQAMYPKVNEGFLFDAPEGVVFGKTEIGTISRQTKYLCKPMEGVRYTDGHALVIGGSGSGKSSAILIPTLLSVSHIGLFCIDIKGELWSKTRRLDDDRVVIVDFQDRNLFGWDALAALNRKASPSDQDIREQMEEIADSLIPISAKDGQEFWKQSARSLLIGELVGLYKQKHIHDLAALVNGILSRDSRELVQELMGGAAPGAVEVKYLSSFEKLADETFSGVCQQQEEALKCFIDDDVQYAFAANPRRACPEMIEEGKEVFLSVREEKLEAYYGVVNLIISQVFGCLIKRPEGSPGVIVAIDELGRLCSRGKIPHLHNEILLTGRSRNITLILITQSFEALQNSYTKEDVQSMISNCSYLAVLDVRSQETAKTICSMAGKYKERETTWSGSGKHRSRSTCYRDHPILEPSDLSRLVQMDEVILITAEYSYCRVKKCSYFKESVLNAKSMQAQRYNREAAGLEGKALPEVKVTLPEEEDFPERTERYIKNKIKEYYTWCTRRLAESLEEAARRLRGR